MMKSNESNFMKLQLNKYFNANPTSFDNQVHRNFAVGICCWRNTLIDNLKMLLTSFF